MNEQQVHVVIFLCCVLGYAFIAAVFSGVIWATAPEYWRAMTPYPLLAMAWGLIFPVGIGYLIGKAALLIYAWATKPSPPRPLPTHEELNGCKSNRIAAAEARK